MNLKSATISLLILFVVAVGAWALLRPAPPPSGPPRTWLSTMDPALLSSITVTWPDKNRAVIERSSIQDLWLLGYGDNGGEMVKWPVVTTRVRAIMRLIADLENSEPLKDEGTDVGTTIELAFRHGVTHRLDISSTALGGKVLVFVHGGKSAKNTARMTDAALARLFARDGLLSWRETAPIVRVTDDVARVRLESAGLRVALRRTLGRWSVQEPLSAAAWHEACVALVNQLHGLPIKRFLDANTEQAPALGLDHPIAFASTEHDVRIQTEGEVTRKTLVQEVHIGGRADAEATTLFATASAFWVYPSKTEREPAWGPVRMILNRSQLDRITADASRYVARSALQVPAADVGGLVLSRHDGAVDTASVASPRRSASDVWITRTFEGWKYKPAEGSLGVLHSESTAGTVALLNLLCDAPADEVTIGEVPTFRTLLRVTVLDSDEALMETMTIGLIGEGENQGMVVRSGTVVRIYRAGAWRGVATWLQDELPPEG